MPSTILNYLSIQLYLISDYKSSLNVLGRGHDYMFLIDTIYPCLIYNIAILTKYGLISKYLNFPALYQAL